MSAVLSLPYIKRKTFCCTLGLLAGVGIAYSLPADVVASVPYVRAAAIVNGLIVGAMISLVGYINYHPLFKFRLPPLLRGAIVAAFVHLDHIIYIFGEPGFWTALIVAAVFGGVVDWSATALCGDGKVLGEGMQA